jgi:hypothetical protein
MRNAKPFVLRNHQNKVLGTVTGTVLSKSIDGSRHMLKRPPAIAFDEQALEIAESMGVTDIVVTDRETGIVYRATMGTLRQRGIKLDRGFGKQVALIMGDWQTESQLPLALEFDEGVQA